MFVFNKGNTIEAHLYLLTSASKNILQKLTIFFVLIRVLGSYNFPQTLSEYPFRLQIICQ